MLNRLAAISAALLVAVAAPAAAMAQQSSAAPPQPAGPERLAPEIEACAAQDRATPPERCKVVFTGSSSGMRSVSIPDCRMISLDIWSG